MNCDLSCFYSEALNTNGNSNIEYGNAVNWGNGHLVYYEINGSILTLGKLGTEAGAAGETRTMRPVFVYTRNGESKTFKFVITYNFK